MTTLSQGSHAKYARNTATRVGKILRALAKGMPPALRNVGGNQNFGPFQGDQGWSDTNETGCSPFKGTRQKSAIKKEGRILRRGEKCNDFFRSKCSNHENQEKTLHGSCRKKVLQKKRKKTPNGGGGKRGWGKEAWGELQRDDRRCAILLRLEKIPRVRLRRRGVSGERKEKLVEWHICRKTRHGVVDRGAELEKIKTKRVFEKEEVFRRGRKKSRIVTRRRTKSWPLDDG